MTAVASKIQVRLVGQVGGPTVGLSRYARSLHQALLADGVAASVVGAQPPPLPAPAIALARRLGFDLGSFFTTYPVSIPPGAPGVVTHVTAQNQASALAWSAPPATVVTVHDLITLFYRNDPELTGYMTLYAKLFDNLTVYGLKRATALIAISEYTRRDIVQRLGYPSDRVTVVPQGIAPDTFRPCPVPDEFFARYGLRPDAPTILYVGSEDPRKNLRRLIDAFGRLLSDLPEARLLKVGTARFREEREQLIAYVERAGLAGKVLFFDQISDADLVCFYNAATVFAFPSLAEGFGLPVLEAMACGTPVVCSDATSVPEVAGDAALLVPPKDERGWAAALRRVLSDPALRAGLRQRGLERARSFTWERTARATAAVYRQVLEREEVGRP